MMESISLREKIGYGFGDMASSMFWKLFGMYLLFFYTDVMGLHAAAVGTMFLITRIWDTVFDPVVGVMTDRTNTKWGKFRPYLLYMAVPFGLIGIITFTVPDFDASGKLVYAYITYSAMMMIYSLINVPYASLLGVISTNTKQRNTLASFRMSFAFAGSLIALALMEPLISYWGGSTQETSPLNAKAWQYAVTIIAIICIVLFLLCFAWVRERVKPIIEDPVSLKQDIKDLIKNRPWWILLLSGVAALIFNSIRDGATIYYFRYFVAEKGTVNFLGTALTYSTLYLVIGQAANMLGVIIASPIANKLGKKQTYFWAMLLASVFSLIFYWMGRESLLPIFILQFLISICAGIVFPLLWSMYADIADYSELKTGRRATGLIFSSSSMSQKLGWTLGGALTGWLLAAFGFQANMEQSESAQTGIRLMLSWLPAIGSILSFVFILFYPLSEKEMERVGTELDIKRKPVDH